jgi:hypothetical protein
MHLDRVLAAAIIRDANAQLVNLPLAAIHQGHAASAAL